MSEEATCVICGKTKPTRRMRYGRHKVEVGSHVTNSAGGRRGNRHSISFGGSSGTRIGNSSFSGNRWGQRSTKDYRRIEGWACSYHGIIGRLFRRMIVIAIIVWAGYAYISGKFTGSQAHHSQHPNIASTADEAAPPFPINNTRSDRVEPAKPEPASRRETSADVAPSDEATKPSAPTEGASLIAEPKSNAEVSAAMTEAVNSGQPVRWHVRHLHGYAVPSAPNASGCRMVQVSVDETGDKSDAFKICP
jgi:hypothetical protein